MDKMIHNSLSAMQGIMARQTAIANNMANAATTGFRAEIVNAKAKHISSAEFRSRALAYERVFTADLNSAAVTKTGRPLDIALDADAMLSVQSRDGEAAYTRRGDLQLSETGLVTTGAGDPVLGEAGPLIIPPSDKISIAKDGGVWVLPQGDIGGEMQQIDRLALVSFSGSDIVKGHDNLFRVRDGGILPQDVDASLTTGSLEGSNVNMTASLVDMIEASRAWETQVKLLSTAKDIDSSGASLMQLPNN
ncbi:flagellar basal body rod protein FlgF [Parasphingorhabdus cellanae]|uniref:Flagellar basal-body rod protein FlgF n=1 Tax=Parasphingorhabdus cellanae TaxID=2806553 RepID=A0ABX7T4I3_9SPHN|nr:flagellar basal body rod protein FlgF [Parasphingorhabdus cellanae]QTD56496.1 flagellar basal body rod protein FlgF [Parasphingorhabdus cellanae]